MRLSLSIFRSAADCVRAASTRSWATRLALGLVAGWLVAAAPEDLATRRLDAMKKVVRRVALETGSAAMPERLVFGDEPIYRYDDPARGFQDGTIWAPVGAGRPAVLLSLSAQRREDGPYWLHEFTSLIDRPVSGGDPSWPHAWNTGPVSLALQAVPEASAPAPDQAGRLRQMKTLARRFKGYDLMSRAGQSTPGRDDLRVLAKPVCRYADPKKGLIDGAIFLMAYGQNPELALLIEARGEGAKEPAWMFGLARISAAESRVELDGKIVWSATKLEGIDPRGAYWLSLKPMRESGELFDDRLAAQAEEPK